MSNWINTTKTATGYTVTASAQNDIKPRSTSFTVSNGMSLSRPVIIFQSGKDSYTVQDLINWGYATYTVKNGYGIIELDASAPIHFNKISNFDDVAKDIERINNDYQNVVIWNQGVPLCMTMEQITNWYSNNSIPIVDLSSTGINTGLFKSIDFDSLEGTFILKISTESQNLSFKECPFVPFNVECPKKFAINVEQGNFDNLQHICYDMRDVEEFTMRAHSLVENNTYADYNYVTKSMNAAFYNCWALKEITGVVCAENLTKYPRWTSTFENCRSLTTIKSNFAKTGTLHMENCVGCFQDCRSLVTIEPILDMIDASGSTGRMFYNCGNLENVKLKNIDGMDYDFTSESLYIPKMSLTSMQYVIDNARTQSGMRNLVFSKLHESELSNDYITAAQNKNWRITFKQV